MKGDDPIKPPGHEQTVRQSKGRQSLVGAQLHFSGHEGDQIEQELDFEPDKGGGLWKGNIILKGIATEKVVKREGRDVVEQRYVELDQ